MYSNYLIMLLLIKVKKKKKRTLILKSVVRIVYIKYELRFFSRSTSRVAFTRIVCYHPN